MKKKNDLYRKSGNNKLALNKQKISELSDGNLGGVKGGGPETWGDYCFKFTFGPKCWESELYTACGCETRDFKGCGKSHAFICEVE